MKHYVGIKYLNPQPKSKEPVLINWTTYIDDITIELFDIDDDGMLKPNEERFKRYEEARLESEANFAYQSESESEEEEKKFYFSYDELGYTFYKDTKSLIENTPRIEDCYVFVGDTTEERIEEGDDDYREVNVEEYLEKSK